MADHSAWHIDAWDARGGRAFASSRERGKDLAEAGSHATIFVGPPGFSSEIVTNTSVALAACRSGTFDRRVPMDEDSDELSFPSPQAVAEFVRRGFIASGSDRGGPPPEAGRAVTIDFNPEGPRGPNPLKAYLERLESVLHDVARSKTALPWEFSLDGKDETADDFVVLGAVRVASLLLSTSPPDFTTPSACAWLDTVQSFLYAVDELAIWQELAHADGTSYARQFASNVLHWMKVEPPNPFFGFLSGDPRYYFSHWSRPWRVSRGLDRFADLFFWPLDARGQSGAASVGQLLSRFVSSPGRFLSLSSDLDIVLFAAAFLASRTVERAGGWRGRAAGTWLRTSMPRWLFTADAEAAITHIWLDEVEAVAQA